MEKFLKMFTFLSDEDIVGVITDHKVGVSYGIKYILY